MDNKTKNYFTIRETSHACGIGRTTLQRMEDDGLIVPAYIGENKYRYYNYRNIYDINNIQLLHECGFTKKQLAGLSMSPENMISLADQIQDKINMLNFQMFNLRSAALSFQKNVFSITEIPELKVYMYKSTREYSFFEMSFLLMDVMKRAIKKGFLLNRYYSPFLSFNIDDFLHSDFISEKYYCTAYIPIIKGPKDPNVITIPAASHFSYTYRYQKGQTRKHLYLLRNELHERELTPLGYPHIATMFNLLDYDNSPPEDVVMRLGIAISLK